MSLPGEEEVAAIRRILLSPPPPGGQKSNEEALKLKELGNAHFRKKRQADALQCYAKAIFLAQWPGDVKQRLAEENLDGLDSCKQSLARSLHSAAGGVPTSVMVDASLLATCFGNRSAVLYEMGKIEECLVDIKQALSLGFPRASEYKLHRRQACCLSQVGMEEEAYQALSLAEQAIRKSDMSKPKQEQLLKEQHSYKTKVQDLLRSSKSTMKEDVSWSMSSHSLCSAYDSKYMCVKSAPEKGRYLEATQQIKPGEILMTEEPFAAVLNPEFRHTHCSHCFTKSAALLPCWGCVSEGYCSTDCGQKAWKMYHWLECPIAHLWNKYDWMLRLCLRMVLSADPSGAQDNYDLICSLVAHGDKLSDGSQKTLLDKMADTLTECLGECILPYLQDLGGGVDVEESEIGRDCLRMSLLTRAENLISRQNRRDLSENSGLATLKQLFLHHLLQLRCNSHSISTVIVDDTASSSSGRSSVQSTSEVQLGSAVYPTASLMNHSCHPNVLFRFTGTRLSVCATREIPAGEEINNCYGPQLGRMKRAKRQAELKRRYFFECRCSACENPSAELQYREAVMDAFQCPSCGGPLLRHDVDSSYQCWKCKRSMPEGELEQAIKVNEEARTMLHTALEDASSSLPLLLKCLKLQSRILHSHNMELAQTNDIIAQAYATQGDFPSACRYSEQSYKAVDVVYGSNSIELANELQKLAQLFFHCHCYSKALELARRARKVLVLYHSPDHPDCTELSEMVEHLSTALTTPTALNSPRW